MSINLGLVKGLREEQRESEQQQQLRKKYSISTADQNIKIVEKSNWGKFLIRSLGTIFHMIFRIILICLAFIGLVAIVYPVPRSSLFEIGTNAIKELIHLFG